jgi:hypothetical protein
MKFSGTYIKAHVLLETRTASAALGFSELGISLTWRRGTSGRRHPTAARQHAKKEPLGATKQRLESTTTAQRLART